MTLSGYKAHKAEIPYFCKKKSFLKIAVNTRLLIPDRLDGIGRFSSETLKLITLSHPEHQFLFIFDRPFDEQFIFSNNITPVIASPQARHPLLFLAWFELSLPSVFKKHKPELFFSPDGFISLNSSVPTVSVIHDLNFEHYPDDLPWSVKTYYRSLFPRFARASRRIATVSEFSKLDITSRYGITEQKIDVVYNGCSELFKPISAAEQVKVRQKFAAGCEYFIFVGSLHPRKNLVNLFKAFDEFRKTDQRGIRLLLAGARMWWTPEIKDAYESMRYKGDVIFTGRVSDPDLAGLMASALALTYVSYFEGFGIPILEAFNCEVPVITSNLSSMPEVAGDAAMLTDPFSIESIAGAMRQVACDEELRTKLIQKGKRQKELFSWKKTAGLVWNTIETSLQTR
jgi:glycosyltransferase involved in cell wall biosynthesis